MVELGAWFYLAAMAGFCLGLWLILKLRALWLSPCALLDRALEGPIEPSHPAVGQGED